MRGGNISVLAAAVVPYVGQHGPILSNMLTNIRL